MDKCEFHSAMEVTIKNQSDQILALTKLAANATPASTIKWGIGIMVLLLLATVSFLWQGQVSIQAESDRADKDFTQKIETVAIQERQEREKIMVKLDTIKETQIVIRTHLEQLKINVDGMKGIPRPKEFRGQ